MVTSGWLTKQQQFFKVLVGNFEKKLMIPNFVRHISKVESSGKAILNVPSGNSWFVRLSITANGLYFKDGWETFLRDNSLKFGDELVFTFIGDMCFHVMIFRECQSAREGKTGESVFSFTSHFPHFVCEMKASSVQIYFVLTVPAKFSKAYLPSKKTTMVLQNDEGYTWDVSLSVQGLQLQHHTLHGVGWKCFSEANDLKLGDYCVFELVEDSKMIVHIYRSKLDMRNQGALVKQDLELLINPCNGGDNICLTSATNTTNSSDSKVDFMG